jgi:hypothetical protein
MKVQVLKGKTNNQLLKNHQQSDYIVFKIQIILFNKMFDYNTIDALKDMVGLDKDDDDGHIYGSAINPINGKKKEEMAKPNAKIEVKTFNRDIKGGATQESLMKYEEEQKKKKERDEKTSIWTEEEVNIKAEEMPDDRPQPKFDVLMK